MGISQQLRHAAEQTLSCQPGGCKACQRKGLPLLPLRRALTPAIGSKLPGDKLTGVNWHEDMLRTLRAGYLYVLLDGVTWQAYQVTPEGALRQFHPFEPPQGAIQPLSQACIHDNHDVPASFINIDIGKYKKAQIAFANDIWPRSVLDAYKRANAPAPRFTIYDLNALAANPEGIDNASTLSKADDLRAKVWEYAATSSNFLSVHGFHGRAHRGDAMITFAQNASKQYALPQGVPMLLLPDHIGMVQEYNALRLRLVEAKAAWAGDPDRAYQWFTSQSLLRIREIEAQWSAAEAATDVQAKVEHTRRWNANPMLASKAALPAVNVSAETKRLTQDKTEDKHKRLEGRYDENSPVGRRQFQADYDKALDGYQKRIDAMAGYYARSCRSPVFAIIDKQDYDTKDAASQTAYIRTMTLCFRGGITDAPPKIGKDGKPLPETGVTALLWKDYVADKDSPPYKAMLAGDRSLLAALAPIFDAKGELDWQDTEKVYIPIAKIITSSDLGERLTQEPMKEAAADLLSAYNGAVERLKEQVAPGVQQVALVVNTSVLRLYQRLSVTQIAVTVKLGDYYAALCETMHDQRKQLATAIEQALGKTKAQADKQVRSLLASGLLSLAVADPKLAEKTFKVVLWIEGEAQALRDSLGVGAKQFGNAAMRAGQATAQNAAPALRELTVLAGTLEPKARGLLKGVQFTGEQTARLTRTGLRGLRGVAGSGELLVSVGGTYLLAQGLKKSFDTVEITVGGKYGEALLALYSASLGVAGGCVEGMGIALKRGAQRATGLTGDALDANAASAAGRTIARWGAVVGAMAGFAGAMSAGMAANRVARSGDRVAMYGYGFSAALSGLGAGFATYAAYAESTAILSSTTFLGPVGWAILLGLSAHLVYQWATSEESTPFERWARRCYFGKHDEEPPVHWKEVTQADTAIAALNAVVLGVDAAMNFSRARATSAIDFDYVRLLHYRLVLPRFNAAHSSYQWALTVRRYNGSQVLANGAHRSLTPMAVQSAPPRHPDYDPTTTKPTVHTEQVKTVEGNTVTVLMVEGRITLDDHHDIDMATLQLSYWPDLAELDAKVELSLAEAP